MSIPSNLTPFTSAFTVISSKSSNGMIGSEPSPLPTNPGQVALCNFGYVFSAIAKKFLFINFLYCFKLYALCIKHLMVSIFVQEHTISFSQDLLHHSTLYIYYHLYNQDLCLKL